MDNVRVRQCLSQTMSELNFILWGGVTRTMSKSDNVRVENFFASGGGGGVTQKMSKLGNVKVRQYLS